MELLSQPTGSSLCGQTCLAMILDIGLNEAIKLVGHKRGTQTKHLTAHFNSSKTLRGLPKNDEVALCICRPAGRAKKGGWHWIVWNKGRIYDPDCIVKCIYSHEDYKAIFNLEISSHIKVLSNATK